MIDPETGQEVVASRPSKFGIAVGRYWLWIAVAAIAVGVLGYVASSLETTKYTATGDVIITEPQTASNAAEDIQTVSSLIDSDGVLAKVAADHSQTLASLQSEVTVTPLTGENIVEIAARDPSPAGADSLVNDIYNTYLSITATLPASQQRVTSMQKPVLPLLPTSPRPLRDGGVGFVLGFLVALGVAWLKEIRRPTAADAELVREELGVPMFADLSRGSFRDRGRRSRDRAFTALSLDLDELAPKGTRVLCLAAVRLGDLSLDLPIGVARAFAAGGWRVIVVDGGADSRLSQELGADGRAGLSDLVNSPGDVSKSLVSIGQDIRLLPYGRKGLDRAQQNLSDELRRIYGDLTSISDLVLVAVPTVANDTEARLVAAAAQGLLLVVRPSTPVAAVEAAHQRLKLFRANFIGFVRDDASEQRRSLRNSKAPQRDDPQSHRTSMPAKPSAGAPAGGSPAPDAGRKDAAARPSTVIAAASPPAINSPGSRIEQSTQWP